MVKLCTGTSCTVSCKFAVQPKVSLFTFHAQFFRLSAAQNAPPSGGLCIKSKQVYTNLMHHLKSDFRFNMQTHHLISGVVYITETINSTN